MDKQGKWNLDKDQLLKEQLRFRIAAWYDYWFMGDQNTKIKHLELLEDEFNPKDFDNPETREDDIVKFLTRLQEKFDKRGQDGR